jgi:phosphatidate cytidylyltransferase
LAASNLSVRLGTAAIGAAVVIPLLFFIPPPGFFLLVLFAAGACAWELGAMAAPMDLFPRVVSVAGAASASMAIYFRADRPIVLLAVLVVATIAQGVALLARPKPIETVATRFAVGIAAPVYAGCLLPFVALLHRPPLGARWVILALVAAWFADSGAYFTGRAFGKTKLAPDISPGKTVEGAIGGLVTAALGCVGVHFLLLPRAVPLTDAVVVGVLGGVLGPVGDLVESLLKRGFGVKDSGRLLPGHGGMLDRVDALMFVAPAAYLWLRLRGVI